MSTSKDQTRIDAFGAWVLHVGGLDRAVQESGVGRRSVERWWTGKAVPPVRLLEELADKTKHQGLADQLRFAAWPATEAADA